MRSISTSCIVLALVFLGLVAGCSRSANPVTPDTSIRGAEGFFGCIEVFDGSEYPYRDLDIATLIKKGDGIYDCLPARIMHDGQQRSFSIMVSIRDVGPPDGKVPMYRWLKDDGTAAWEEAAFGIPSGPLVDYKFPKVDAIWVPQEESIWVAVSFMWRFRQPMGPYDNSWNIGVIFLHWDEDDFAYSLTLPPPEEELHIMDLYADGTQWGHDIAFDASVGDGYLVYTTDTGAMQSPFRLKYRHFTRNPSPPPEWRFTDPYWAVAQNFVGNMWLPSLDVGRCVMPGYEDPEIFVGVAFTYKESNQPFKVAFSYWVPAIDGDKDQTDHTVIHYIGSEVDYGLPCLDIAPNNSVPPYFAITWVQENTDDWLYDVWVADSISNDMMRLHRGTPQDPDYRQKTLPSIACHYCGAMYDAVASVSMYENLAQGEPTGTYQPLAFRVNFDEFEIEAWHFVQEGYDGVFGPWGPFNVAYMDSGVATDIVVYNEEHNNYYIGFADSIGTVTDPTTVYAAWGNTTQ